MSVIIASLKQFFFMGGYGFYIWFAYGITFAIIALNIVLARRKKSLIHKRLLTTSSLREAQRRRNPSTQPLKGILHEPSS